VDPRIDFDNVEAMRPTSNRRPASSRVKLKLRSSHSRGIRLAVSHRTGGWSAPSKDERPDDRRPVRR
jgi:hypothetical protein